MTTDKQTAPFRREVRYEVIKIDDISECLSMEETETLMHLTDKIHANRITRGKIPLKCVVVESDWPIYEQTWDAVQRLAEGKEQEVTELKVQNQLLWNTIYTGTLNHPVNEDTHLQWRFKAELLLTEIPSQSLASHNKQVILDVIEAVKYQYMDATDGFAYNVLKVQEVEAYAETKYEEGH